MTSSRFSTFVPQSFALSDINYLCYGRTRISTIAETALSANGRRSGPSPLIRLRERGSERHYHCKEPVTRIADPKNLSINYHHQRRWLGLR